MSTLRIAVKAVTVAGALLATQATVASDVTADSRQASTQEATRASDRKVSAEPQDRDSPKASMAKSCTCSHASPPTKPGSAVEEEELNRLRSQNG